MSYEYYTTKVKITTSRWFVKFELDLLDDEEKTITFVASADSYFTDGDGIWFGTSKEYEEVWDELNA